MLTTHLLTDFITTISVVCCLLLFFTNNNLQFACASVTFESVSLQACSSRNCTNGTCHTRVTARENKCLNEFFNGVSQKMKCIYRGPTNTKTGLPNLCIRERYWFDQKPGTCDDKIPHVIAQTPCGVCSQTASLLFARLDGCENGFIGKNHSNNHTHGFAKFSYNCQDSACSRCRNTMLLPVRQCLWRGDRMFSIDDVYECPMIVSLNSYSGFGCDSLKRKGPTVWLSPGYEKCYSDIPNYGTQLLCQEKAPAAASASASSLKKRQGEVLEEQEQQHAFSNEQEKELFRSVLSEKRSSFLYENF